MFKKVIVFLIPCVFLMGCGSKNISTVVTGVEASVVLNGDDLIFGDIVKASMDYDPKDPLIKEKVMAKAIEGKDYDFILMPKYTVTSPAVGKSIISVTGRGTKIKNK